MYFLIKKFDIKYKKSILILLHVYDPVMRINNVLQRKF